MGEHPRARGENTPGQAPARNPRGNIPAHAGKTATDGEFPHATREHPRARGENGLLDEAGAGNGGTSPRTRGKLPACPPPRQGLGNIPAHAGKTAYCSSVMFSPAEHPRARGENLSGTRLFFEAEGTSPRTRGKQPGNIQPPPRSRNIPAHAGKTGYSIGEGSAAGEHPRARGENAYALLENNGASGTSPRTRGKRIQHQSQNPRLRNIPAHAGKTRSVVHQGRNGAEHPRARGENAFSKVLVIGFSGTSPRTRGKRKNSLPCTKIFRNIPAHAGKTLPLREVVIGFAEHPRARGENKHIIEDTPER